MKTIKVMTYNIRHGQGMDGKVDLARIARVVDDAAADIVALQEVDDNWKRSGNIDQTWVLAHELNMNYQFGPALVKGKSRYGNALLSKLEGLSYNNHLLSSKRENRAMLEGYYDCTGRLICVMNVHLGLSASERHAHLTYILQHISHLDLPLLLVGDLNMRPEDPEIERINEVLFDGCTVLGMDFKTFPSVSPYARIDYIFYSPEWRVHEVNVIDSLASDHLPVIAHLELD